MSNRMTFEAGSRIMAAHWLGAHKFAELFKKYGREIHYKRGEAERVRYEFVRAELVKLAWDEWDLQIVDADQWYGASVSCAKNSIPLERRTPKYCTELGYALVFMGEELLRQIEEGRVSEDPLPPWQAQYEPPKDLPPAPWELNTET